MAQFDLSSWRERGVITIDGVEHRVFRESLLGDFVIERGSSTLARATKKSAFTNTMIVKHDGREYTLRKQSWWRRAFVLMDGDTADWIDCADGHVHETRGGRSSGAVAAAPSGVRHLAHARAVEA